MTKDQAINLLTQVCQVYKGTLQEHQMLQQALEVVRNLEEKKDAKSTGEITEKEV